MQKTLSLLFFTFICVIHASAQLNISAGVTPSTLVNSILGSGVYASNITVNGAPPLSWGTFTCSGTCNIGLPAGVILTSGSASLASQPNTGPGQGVDMTAVGGSGMGDALLNTLTTGPTLDACVLEFDFTVPSDSLHFNYIFFSEEYSEYVNSQFNDVFGFFISGPGITGQQNIALIPGTPTSVAINNVNNGYSPAGTPPSGPCNNCAYFIDNTQSFYTMAYDGMTTVMSVNVGVMPCATYHIKLAVADVADHVYDSGVFIEAGTFSGPAISCVLIDGQVHCNDTIHICQGDSVLITAPGGPNYLWNTGATTQSINVSQAGTYSCQYINSPCAAFSLPVKIVADSIVPVPVLTQSADTLFSSVTSPNYIYSWTLNGNLLPGANTPQLIISQNGCYVLTVSDPASVCPPVTDTLCVVNLGIHTNDFANTVMLTPNPFTHYALLTFGNPAGENFSLTISDVAGKELRTITDIYTAFVKVEKENLSPGIYFYELKNKKGASVKGKFMVR